MLQSWNQLCFKVGMLEASISLPGKGQVSGFMGPGQSNPVGIASQSAQLAPFDIWYQPNYGKISLAPMLSYTNLITFQHIDFIEVYNRSITQMNAYRGGAYQQALSGVTTL